MRVARSFAAGDVRIEEAPEPEAGPGEVVCDVLACGVCGSDVTDWYIAPRLPAVLGHEVVERSAPSARASTHQPLGHASRSTITRRAASAGVAGAATRRLCERFRATRLDPGGFAERVRIMPELVPELLELPTTSTR